jgi:hypothetical protein
MEKITIRIAKKQIPAKYRSPVQPIIMPLSCQNGIFLFELSRRLFKSLPFSAK